VRQRRRFRFEDRDERESGVTVVPKVVCLRQTQGGRWVPHTSGYARGASPLMWGFERCAVSDRGRWNRLICVKDLVGGGDCE
jgi:hypothetical protein